MIPVTKPFLPPIEEYQDYVSEIWERNWLTNNGPLVKQLEIGIASHLGLDNFSYLSNGTIAIQFAIKVLDLQGEIITTPFSYVATTSSIVWESCKPIFVDIDSKTLNIDPLAIEKAITAKTTAILATHVYGNPCDVEAIEQIAKKHHLKVIYDAAHCYGTTYKGKSILEYGDISTISFHATKLFHTTEGGGVYSNNKEVMSRILRLRNFGHSGIETFDGIGVNGKNSEFHAAMGLVNLNYIDQIIQKRKSDYLTYSSNLKSLTIKKIAINENVDFNCSYFPIQFESEKKCLEVVKALNEHDIFPRRYFYPLLSTLNYVEFRETPVAERVSKQILCLPMYYELEKKHLDLICDVINKTLS